MDDFKVENWMPMPLEMGPPLPQSMGIYWPWHKPAVLLPEVVPPTVPVAALPVIPVVVVAPPAVLAAAPVIAYPPPAPPVIVYPPEPPPPEVLPELIYACPLCPAQFPTLSELEAHLALVHPPAPPEVPAPPATYYLYVVAVGGGVVTPGTGDYPAHLPLTLIATPIPGFEFDYWGGDVSGTIPVVSIVMDGNKVVTAYFKELPPPELPPPKLPTVSILSATFTPSEATVGDVVSTTISWMPAMPRSPELFDFGISADLINSAGERVMNVLTATPTAEIGMLQATPFSLDTTGLSDGWYGLEVSFSDLMTGVEIAKQRFPNLLHLLPLPEIVLPEIVLPEIPAPPVRSEFILITVNLGPTQVEVGDTLRVPLSYDHVGAGEAVVLYAAIGKERFGVFDEFLYAQKSVSVPADVSITSRADYIGIPITSRLTPGIYDVYAKVDGLIPKAISPTVHNVVEVVVPYAGSIVKKELEYNESRGLIPVSNIPQGKRGLVHIWGRNDMTTRQKLGIHWIVKDPDGLIVEDYQGWQFTRESPGSTHEFIGGRFDINKPGDWTISISLSMNPESPVTVHRYDASLCTVIPIAPPAEYTLEVTIEPPGAGHVLISPKAPYSAGEVVTLVATPYPGYEFDHWGGDASGTIPTVSLLMDSDKAVTAYFKPIEVPVITIEEAPPPAPPREPIPYWQWV